MTSSCLKPLRVRVNLSPEELSALDNDLRFEFGPFVVTPTRATELRAIVALADKDIEDHDLEVASLTEQITFLRGQNQRLGTQRAKLLSLLSPVRKLPNEILLRIFQHVCEENLLQSYPWSKWGGSPPTIITSPYITYLPTMAISSVCSRWRELALSTPSLWANLTVEIHTTPWGEAEALIGFIDTVILYLERSGDSPIRLALSIQGPSHAMEVPSLIHLTQHACRWKAFKYAGDYSLMAYGILHQLRFPILAELDIVRGARGDELDRFNYCPKLCALSTIQSTLGPTAKLLYSQLDHLSYHGSVPTSLSEALHSCPSLKSLELSCWSRHTPPAEGEGALGTWRNILSLTLRTSLDTVFSSFNFPSLNELRVVGTHVIWSANAFASFIFRSSCMITTFTLRGISMLDSELITALQVMPSLLHLEVDQYPHNQNAITSYLIASLASTSTFLVPKLHSLYLRSASTDFNDSGFVSMVESRWFKPGSDLSVEGRACIRSVALQFTSREVDADIYKPLRILDAEGLRVVVGGTNEWGARLII